MNDEVKEDCEILAKCYTQEGRYADAVQLYQDYINMIRSATEGDHPWIGEFEEMIRQLPGYHDGEHWNASRLRT